ncbi:MAG: UDP-N-acetylglucosamine--N-acetylmuramyl-(pentapeptide) pyrophosphoryl-undecaprenol N-acetylglucosamine transferase [Lentisphaerae bacterium]|nr:UDP-N-acetylglucosamine--N-acetylmuramyl-(pentapeptide) pyrophosphoryl-undecaprenol N-acetylglucosamine transferase [Lentisphaerota bacterium]
MKIGIACGGTGGHIFPGLAAAMALRQRGHEVRLYLAGKPGEDLALTEWVGTVETVPARGVSSRDPWTLVATCAALIRAVLQSRQSLRRFSPDVFLAMGSYASVGPVLAARWLRIPVVLHEANVIPGRAISFLSRFAAAVAVSFSETRAHLTHARLCVTGMPVRGTEEQTPACPPAQARPGSSARDDGRQMPDAGCQTPEVSPDQKDDRRQPALRSPERSRRGEAGTPDAGPQSEIENQKSRSERDRSNTCGALRAIENWGALAQNVFTILIMGGSRGAHRLNEIVCQAIMRLHGEGHPLQVIHLTGLADEHAIRQAYRHAGVPHAVFGFLRDMPRAYRLSALAICRSGASTCAELAFYGVPALLVPYPFAVHRHQTANADALAACGAADLCDEQILTVDWLADYITGVMRDPARLARQCRAARKRVTNNSAAALAELVEEVGRQEDRRRMTDGRRQIRKRGNI